MIRREWEGGWLLILQTEHARLSGFMGGHWGSGDFIRPGPWEEALLAAAEHDNGWREWEERPGLNAEGAPAHFTETPLDENFNIFRRGVKRLYDQGHPYAAALVSRHAANVYAGVRSVRSVNAEEAERIGAYIAEQEETQAAIRRELAGRPGLERFLAQDCIRRNGRFVTTLDALSLVLCCGWSHVRRLREVPVGEDGFTHLDLRLGDGVHLHVTPWPFDRDDLTFSARGRRLSARPFPSPEAFRAALERAPVAEVVFRLTPGPLGRGLPRLGVVRAEKKPAVCPTQN